MLPTKEAPSRVDKERESAPAEIVDAGNEKRHLRRVVRLAAVGTLVVGVAAGTYFFEKSKSDQRSRQQEKYLALTGELAHQGVTAYETNTFATNPNGHVTVDISPRPKDPKACKTEAGVVELKDGTVQIILEDKNYYGGSITDKLVIDSQQTQTTAVDFIKDRVEALGHC